MGRNLYHKRGFAGLTMKGKLLSVLVWAISTLVAIFLFPLFIRGMTYADLFQGLTGGNPQCLIIYLVYGGGIGLAASWIANHFLPKKTYYTNDYFCADCGQFLGEAPRACSRCGCNRYTKKDTGVGRTFRSR